MSIFFISYLSCSNLSKNVDCNNIEQSLEDYRIVNCMEYKKIYKKKFHQVELIKNDELLNYEIIGEFEIVKFIDLNNYRVSTSYTLITGIPISPMEIINFGEDVKRIVSESHKKAIAEAEKKYVNAISYYGTKTNNSKGYKKNTILLDIQPDCPNYLVSKYYMLNKSRK